MMWYSARRIWLWQWRKTVPLAVQQEHLQRQNNILELPQSIRSFERLRLYLWEARMYYEAINNVGCHALFWCLCNYVER